MAFTYDDASLTYDSVLSTFDGGSTQFTPYNLRVDLWLKTEPYNYYTNVTRSVLTERGVSWSRGRTSESGPASPGQAHLTFYSPSGAFSPRNTAGSLYGLIGRNSPIRIGFGSPVLGKGTSGTTGLTCPQVDAAAGDAAYATTGVMAVGWAQPVGNFTIPAGYSGKVEVDASTFTMCRAFNTDNAVVSSAAYTYSTTPTHTGMAHVQVPGGVFAAGADATAVGGAALSMTVSATNDNQLCTVVHVWESDAAGRMGAPIFASFGQPQEPYLVSDTGPSTGPRVKVWAWVQRNSLAGSVQFLGPDDNTYAQGLEAAWWTAAARYTPRFTGEVAEWPVEWDESGALITTPVEAGGVSRRIAASQDESSALKSLISGLSPLDYWTMEDPTGSTTFASYTGGNPGRFVNTVTPSSVASVVGSDSLPAFTGGGGRFTPAAPYAAYGVGAVFAIPAAGTAAGTNLLVLSMGGGGSTVNTIGIEYTNSTTLSLKAVDSTGAGSASSLGSLVVPFPNGLNGHQILIWMGAQQNGANYDFNLYVHNVTPGEPYNNFNVTSSVVGTIGTLKEITTCVESGNSATIGTNDIAAGHVFVLPVYNHGAALPGYAARGWDAAPLSAAAAYTARGAGYQMGVSQPTVTDPLLAGPLQMGSTLGQLQDLETVGQAFMQDAAGYVGLDWRPLPFIENQTSKLTLSYTDKIFSGQLAPTDDDTLTVNTQTVESTLGTVGYSQRLTGALGAQAGGVGKYASSVLLPVPTGQATYLAQWLTGLGTLDEARWPTITLEMAAPGAAAYDMTNLAIGDTVTVTNLPSYAGPSSVDLVIIGISEEIISTGRWTVTLHTRPQRPYDVLVWDSGDVWADTTAAATDSFWGIA